MAQSDFRVTAVSPQGGNKLTDTLRGMLDELDKFRTEIEEALAYANHSHSFDDLVGMILAGRLVWVALPKSFFVLETITYPQYMVLHVFLAGGDLEEILAQQNFLVQIAIEQRCRYVTLAGRRGWSPVLQKQRWKVSATYMTLGVEDEQRRQANHYGTSKDRPTH